MLFTWEDTVLRAKINTISEIPLMHPPSISPNGGNSLTVSEPHIDFERLLIVRQSKVNSHVVEGAVKGPKRSSDGNLSGLDCNVN